MPRSARLSGPIRVWSGHRSRASWDRQVPWRDPHHHHRNCRLLREVPCRRGLGIDLRGQTRGVGFQRCRTPAGTRTRPGSSSSSWEHVFLGGDFLLARQGRPAKGKAHTRHPLSPRSDRGTDAPAPACPWPLSRLRFPRSFGVVQPFIRGSQGMPVALVTRSAFDPRRPRYLRPEGGLSGGPPQGAGSRVTLGASSRPGQAADR